MLIRFKYLLVLFLVFFSHLGFAQWVQQEINGQAGDFRFVYVTEGDSVYAVGDNNGYGMVARSQDGTIWKDVELVSFASFLGADFLDADTGFVVGSWGVYFNTNDGMYSWGNGNCDTPNDVWDASMVDSKKIFVIGADDSLRKTTDGGFTWSSYVLFKDGFPATPNCVLFSDEMNGFVGAIGNGFVPNGIILHTTDGGNTWDEINFDINTSVEDIHFPSADTGYAVGMNLALKTVDGGVKWEKLEIPADVILSAVHFYNNNEGFAVGNQGVILSTNDGGQTWVEEESGVTDGLYAIHCNNKACYAVGNQNIILHRGILTSRPNENTLSSTSVSLINNGTSSPFRLTEATGEEDIIIHSLEGKMMFEGTYAYWLTNDGLSNFTTGLYTITVIDRNESYHHKWYYISD